MATLRPTECSHCEGEFLRRPMLQDEARHVAAIEGPQAAEAMVNDALASYHDEHGRQ